MKPTKPGREAARDALLLACCAAAIAVPWELRHLVDGRRWLLRQSHDTDSTWAGTPGVGQC